MLHWIGTRQERYGWSTSTQEACKGTAICVAGAISLRYGELCGWSNGNWPSWKEQTCYAGYILTSPLTLEFLHAWDTIWLIHAMGWGSNLEFKRCLCTCIGYQINLVPNITLLRTMIVNVDPHAMHKSLKTLCYHGNSYNVRTLHVPPSNSCRWYHTHIGHTVLVVLVCDLSALVVHVLTYGRQQSISMVWYLAADHAYKMLSHSFPIAGIANA